MEPEVKNQHQPVVRSIKSCKAVCQMEFKSFTSIEKNVAEELHTKISTLVRIKETKWSTREKNTHIKLVIAKMSQSKSIENKNFS